MPRWPATSFVVITLMGVVCAALLGAPTAYAAAAPAHGGDAPAFPRSLESYDDADMEGLWNVLRHRMEVEPFNLWATIFFFF